MYGFTKLFSNPFAGKSADHFNSAAGHLKAATIGLKDVSAYAVYAAYNTGMTCAQVGVGYALYEAAAGKVVAANSLMQISASISGYIAPGTFGTKAMYAAAATTKVTAEMFVKYPTATMGAIAGVPFLKYPGFAKEAVKNTGFCLFEAAKVGVNISAAGAETLIGGALLGKETVEKTHNIVQQIIDGQDGFGVEGRYTQSDDNENFITPRENLGYVADCHLVSSSSGLNGWTRINKIMPSIQSLIFNDGMKNDWVEVNGDTALNCGQIEL